MHEALKIHDILDPLMPLPLLGSAHAAHIQDLLDPSRPPRHHRDAVGKVNRLVHGMGDEQNRARIDASDAPPA
jgi:hypothetical protein